MIYTNLSFSITSKLTLHPIPIVNPERFLHLEFLTDIFCIGLGLLLVTLTMDMDQSCQNLNRDCFSVLRLHLFSLLMVLLPLRLAIVVNLRVLIIRTDQVFINGILRGESREANRREQTSEKVPTSSVACMFV